MLVIPELEKEVQLLWELRDDRKVLISFIIFIFLFFVNKIVWHFKNVK
jgi:hypothetical protein